MEKDMKKLKRLKNIWSKEREEENDETIAD